MQGAGGFAGTVGVRAEFAGLWDMWRSSGGDRVGSCTIVTTEPNELIAPVHNRMPVILTGDACALWLDPEVEDHTVLQDLLKPYPADAMDSYAVSPLVNNVRNNGPECIQRVA